MDLTAQIDAYCERTGPEFWSEPLNALTNIAFLLAAIWAWPRVRGMAGGQVLAVILVLIAVGSGLNHTLAVAWAAAADTLAILHFILAYIYLATRDILLRPIWQAVLAVILFFPYAALTVPLFAWLGSSAGYAPIPVLIAGYAFAARARNADTARRLAIGAGLLAVSIAVRTVDEPLCSVLPTGTHFLWHILNAIMLAWMIEAWRAHMLAGGQAPR